MSHQEFMHAPANRQRYWARSLVGFGKYLAGVKPNRCHIALALLQSAGHVQHIITQNVDGLHTQAGSAGVTDLHGRIDRVRCMRCGEIEDRVSVQRRMIEENSVWVQRWASLSPSDGKKAEQRADGDAELSNDADYSMFHVPRCLFCGNHEDSILKPDVVYFGDNVPKEKVAHALAQVDACDGLLVVGSSLEVFSAFRFVLRACGTRHKEAPIVDKFGGIVAPNNSTSKNEWNMNQQDPPVVRGAAQKPICILNLGETRAERSGIGPLLKIHLPCDEALWSVVVREGIVEK
jgi:NAD-dependent SIR2 family protein deacetylase